MIAQIHALDVSLAHANERRLVVRGVSATAEPSTPLAVLGPAGSGKSTLLAAMAAIGEGEAGPVFQGGDIATLGTSLRSISNAQRVQLSAHIGFVAQNASERLGGFGTVSDVVASPIFDRDARFDRAVAGARVAAVVDSMRLPLGILAQPIYELSRGQRQRVALARALVLEPTALVVDDPLSGLDPVVRPGIAQALHELSKSMAVVAAVRSPAEARALGGTALVLHRGLTIGQGVIDEVLQSARHEYISALASSDR